MRSFGYKKICFCFEIDKILVVISVYFLESNLLNFFKVMWFFRFNLSKFK